MKQNLSLLVVFILFSACKNNNDSQNAINTAQSDTLADYSLALSNVDTYVKAALETCDCMQPMIDKVNEIKNLSENNSNKAIIQKEKELIEIRSKVDICSAEIRNKYGAMTSANEKKRLLAALKKYCPDSYKMIY